MQCSSLTGMLQTQASHGHQRLLPKVRGVAISRTGTDCVRRPRGSALIRVLYCSDIALQPTWSWCPLADS